MMECSIPCQQHQAICVEVQFVRYGALDTRFWAWIETPDYCEKRLDQWLTELYMERFPHDTDDPYQVHLTEVLKNSVQVEFNILGKDTKLFHVLRENDTLIVHTLVTPNAQELVWDLNIPAE